MNNHRITSTVYFVHCVASGVKTYNMHPDIYARCKHCNPDSRSTVTTRIDLKNGSHEVISITYRHGPTGKVRLQRFNAIVKAIEEGEDLPSYVIH